MIDPPVEHVLLHVRDALATDSRVGELGLDVTQDADGVVVRGAISNAARKEALAHMTPLNSGEAQALELLSCRYHY